MTGTMSETYRGLQQTYSSDKQKRWINGLMNDLSNINKRRMYLDDLERLEYEHAERVTFDGNRALLPFENGVYDSRTLSFRSHQAQDYVTSLIPYSLPDAPNPYFRSELEKTLKDMLPSDEVRQFLLTVLSLSLEGSNRHNLAMIWTGGGGNGKSILKGMVARAFGVPPGGQEGVYHREPAATFLTGERPSSDKPNADLIDLMLARMVITSEPQAGKKINTGFVKFITGNDSVRVRALNCTRFQEYTPRFIVTLICNTVPLIEGGEEDTRGIWRRLNIIHFGTEFVYDPDPNRPNQKMKDVTLEERANHWGPDFMLLLMETYKTHINNGGRIYIPEEVQRNLQEQKEDNDKMEMWMEANLVRDGEKRIHLHRITRAHDKMMKRVGRVSTIVAKLKAQGYNVSELKVHARDYGCCKSLCRYVTGVSLLPWSNAEGDENGKVDESKGVAV